MKGYFCDVLPDEIVPGQKDPTLLLKGFSRPEGVAAEGLDPATWAMLAKKAGELAAQYGPQLVSLLQQWWAGSESQVDVGTVTVRKGEQFLVDIRNIDDEARLVMPGFVVNRSLNQAPFQQVWAFNIPGETIFMINCTNNNGPWSCNVAMYPQSPTGGFNLNRPFVYVRDNGNDNLWQNRRRLYLGRVRVIDA